MSMPRECLGDKGARPRAAGTGRGAMAFGLWDRTAGAIETGAG
jgi:hypothetical protein